MFIGKVSTISIIRAISRTAKENPCVKQHELMKDCCHYVQRICYWVWRGFTAALVLKSSKMIFFCKRCLPVSLFLFYTSQHNFVLKAIYLFLFCLFVATGRGSRRSPPSAWRGSRPAGDSLSILKSPQSNIISIQKHKPCY